MTEIIINDIIQEKTCVALGLFDGLHHGHRRVIEAAKCGEYAPAVFTFRTESVKEKHGRPLEYIYTNARKLELLYIAGIKYAFCPDFSDVKDMSGEEFVSEIICGIMNAGKVVCGENFRFGKMAQCGVEELKGFGEKYGFEVETVELDGFSSEKFREFLREGRVNELYKSGNAYTLSAKVAEGNRIGRTLDFPTINQHFAENQLVPKRGVYHTRTIINGKIYPCVTNVGVKPTVEKDIKPLAETHIIGFSGNLYGMCPDVEFCGYIRGERKFASLEELKNQVFADIAFVREQYESAEASGKD